MFYCSGKPEPQFPILHGKWEEEEAELGLLCNLFLLLEYVPFGVHVCRDLLYVFVLRPPVQHIGAKNGHWKLNFYCFPVPIIGCGGRRIFCAFTSHYFSPFREKRGGDGGRRKNVKVGLGCGDRFLWVMLSELRPPPKITMKKMGGESFWAGKERRRKGMPRIYRAPQTR